MTDFVVAIKINAKIVQIGAIFAIFRPFEVLVYLGFDLGFGLGLGLGFGPGFDLGFDFGFNLGFDLGFHIFLTRLRAPDIEGDFLRPPHINNSVSALGRRSSVVVAVVVVVKSQFSMFPIWEISQLGNLI